jgi:2-iminoacetate synthase ThiH
MELPFHLQRSGLRDLYDKVVANERLTEADALRLFESKDLNVLGAMADFARQRKVGNRASYIVNRYINYSNYCILLPVLRLLEKEARRRRLPAYHRADR